MQSSYLTDLPRPPHSRPVPRINRNNRDLREYAVRFYQEHKRDPQYAFRTKEEIALYLHDIELPRHFEAASLPSWTRIRSWLPKEGRLKDMG